VATHAPFNPHAAISSLLKSCRGVSPRATQAIKIAEKNNWLLLIAFDHITLGRAALSAAVLEGRDGRLLLALFSNARCGGGDKPPRGRQA
jgi:hypothetical protein